MNSELDDVEKLLDSLVAKEKDDEVLIGWFARGRLHLTKKRSPQRFFKPSERQAEVGVPFLEELHFLRTDCRRERVFCHRRVTFPVAPSTRRCTQAEDWAPPLLKPHLGQQPPHGLLHHLLAAARAERRSASRRPPW